MTMRAQEYMTGNERLILTSGGGDSTRFFKQMLALSPGSVPRVLIDQSAAPNRHAFDEQRRELHDFFVQATGVLPDWLQPEFGKQHSPRTIQSKLAEANILYADNGNARRFASAWEWWFRSAVSAHVREGSLVGAGSGAGALLWFARGHSNARRHEVAPEQRWNYTLIKGLGVIPAWATTHWDQERPAGSRSRQERFEETLASHRKDWHNAIGLDSAVILSCVNGVFEVLKSRTSPQPAAHVYRADPKNPTTYYPGDPFRL